MTSTEYTRTGCSASHTHQSTWARTVPSDHTSPNTGACTRNECRWRTAATAAILFWRYACSSNSCAGFLSSQTLLTNSKHGSSGSAAHGEVWYRNVASDTAATLRGGLTPGWPLRIFQGEVRESESRRTLAARMKIAQSGTTVRARRIRTAWIVGFRCDKGCGREMVHCVLREAAERLIDRMELEQAEIRTDMRFRGWRGCGRHCRRSRRSRLRTIFPSPSASTAVVSMPGTHNAVR